MTGLFIVFEGIDGSGKTTQARMLYEHLNQELERDVHLTREPTDGLIGKLLRSSIDDHGEVFDEETRCYLFAADRRHHLRTEIEPQLERGNVVICDRYVMSTFAYQRCAEDAPRWERIYEIHGPHVFREPDLTLFLDVPVAVALTRLETRTDKLSWYETPARLQALYAAYLDAPRSPELFAHVDASGTKEQTFGQILLAVDRRLSAQHAATS